MIHTGQMVRMCRNSLNWSRQHLSEKSGVPAYTIVTVEGKPDCKVSTFEKLIEAMGYEVEVLRKER